MDEHLCIPVDPFVKLVIRNLGVLNSNLVRDDKAGLCLAGNDEVTQVSVVGLDVALACAEGETLGLVSLDDICRLSKLPFRRACQSLG